MINGGYSAEHRAIYQAIEMAADAIKIHLENREKAIEERIDSELQISTNGISKEQVKHIMYSTIYEFNISSWLVIFVVTTSAYIEAMINWISSVYYDDLIEIESKLSLIDKWKILPKKYIQNYVFPKELEDKLRELVKDRNRILHHKPSIQDEKGNVITDGSGMGIHNMINPDVDKLVRLPKELLENIRIQITDKSHFLLYSSFCELYTERANFR